MLPNKAKQDMDARMEASLALSKSYSAALSAMLDSIARRDPSLAGACEARRQEAGLGKTELGKGKTDDQKSREE